MTLFRLDASIRTTGSKTRELVDIIEKTWRSRRPDSDTIRRDLGMSPLPADAWQLALAGRPVHERGRTSEQAEAIALATRLVDEFVSADAYVIGSPLYNMGASSSLKVWADLMLTDPRTPPVVPSPVAGRPAALVVARGGEYGPGTPRDGWDHGTAWLRRILADVLCLDVHVVEVELTMAKGNIAMKAKVPKAEASLRDAAEHAQQLALWLDSLAPRRASA